MKKCYLLPVVSVLGGIGGFALRRLHLQTAFESDTGLPIAGTAASYGLFALSLGLALLLLFLARNREQMPMPYAGAFGGGVLYFLGAALGALLTGAGAVFTFLNWRAADGGVLELCFVLFALLAALCMLLIAVRNYRLGWMGPGSLPLLAPPFFCCLWLMLSYQAWARDPVVSDYVFALFAIMSTMLAYYYMAAYSFGQPRELLTLLFGGLAVYFCIICLADRISLASACLFLGAACYALAHVAVLAKNRLNPFENPNTPPGPAEPLRAEAPDAAFPEEERPHE